MSAWCDENGSRRNIFVLFANVVFIIDCLPETKALAIIISVTGAVPVVALALLVIWRVLATIQLSCTEEGSNKSAFLWYNPDYDLILEISWIMANQGIDQTLTRLESSVPLMHSDEAILMEYILLEIQCFITYQTSRIELKIQRVAEYFW